METIEAESNKQQRCAFKSYYVVWKQKKIAYMETDISSLNRTMQYGNLGAGILAKNPIIV